jgi:tetratricopeptide (TPR) repeat protein
VKVCLLLAACLASPLLAEESRITALVQQGDAADARHDSQAALLALQQAEQIDGRNFGVLLRISKQYTDLSGECKDSAVAKLLAEKALDYGQRAVGLDDKNAKAHLNLAICYGKLTDFVGSKTKVDYARIIRDEAERSLFLDPADDYAWHVLARWHVEVANLNGVLKVLANLVYSSLPPASNEDAVRCFRKASELAPQRVMHHAELLKLYTRMAKSDSAAQEWQNVVGLKSDGAQDEQYQREAKIALEQFRKQGAAGNRGVAHR